jgi:hypothetical protein
MSALTDDIRAKASAIISDANAIDAQGGGNAPSWPSPVDCLAGAFCLSRGSLDTPFDFFEVKMNEYERLNYTAPSGSILIFGDSLTNFWAADYLSAFAVNLGCYGMGYRHLIRAMMRGWEDDAHQLSQPISGGGIQGMLHRAGAVVIHGCGGNALDQEIAGGRTLAQALANIDYALQNTGGLAGSLTGKGVIVCNPPTVGTDSNASNANLYTVNETIIKKYFSGKSGWAVVDVNETLAPGWHANGGAVLASQYQLTDNTTGGGPSNDHGNKAFNDVIKAGIIAGLASVGVTA